MVAVADGSGARRTGDIGDCKRVGDDAVIGTGEASANPLGADGDNAAIAGVPGAAGGGRCLPPWTGNRSIVLPNKTAYIDELAVAGAIGFAGRKVCGRGNRAISLRAGDRCPRTAVANETAETHIGGVAADRPGGVGVGNRSSTAERGT